MSEPSSSDLMGLMDEVLGAVNGMRSDQRELSSRVDSHILDEATWKSTIHSKLDAIATTIETHDGPFRTVQETTMMLRMGRRLAIGVFVLVAAGWSVATWLYDAWMWIRHLPPAGK
jgi:hypothetical protein